MICLLFFAAPQWRCELYLEELCSPGLMDGFIVVKRGGWVEKQGESWISEGNSLCLHGNERCPVSALFLRAVKTLPPVSSLKQASLVL